MANQLALQDQAMASMADRQVLMPPLHLLHNCEKSDPERDVEQIISVPIILTGGDCYPRGATAWRDHKMDTNVQPYLFFLQFMMLLVEHVRSLGSRSCTICPDQDPRSYKRACKLAAKRMIHQPVTKDECKWFDAVTYFDDYVDCRFQYDTSHWAAVLQWKKKHGKKEKPGPKKKKKKESAKDRAFDQWCVDHLGTLEIFGLSGSRPTCWRRAAEDDEEVQSDEAMEVPEEEAEREEEDARKGRGEKSDESEPVYVPYPAHAPTRVLKVQMILTTIPYAENKKIVCGMLANFLIRDKQIHPGAFYAAVIKNARTRQNARHGRFRTFIEMFPTYQMYYNRMHPAGNRASKELYMDCVRKLVPDIVRDHFENSYTEMLANTHFDRGHTDIYRILSLERAITALSKAGGDPVVLGSAASWHNEEAGTLSFPGVHSRTWKFVTAAVFWDHPVDLGFKEFYFPFVETENNFLRQLVLGSDMRAIIAQKAREAMGISTDDEEESLLEKHVNDAFSVVRKLLTNNVRVDRGTLLGSSTVSYPTNNEFIHKDAEARPIYDAIKKYYPCHYSDTLTMVQTRIDEFGIRWRDRLTEVERKRVEECELYNDILNESQNVRCKEFCALYQVDGDVDSLPIPDPIKAQLHWYKRNRMDKLPHMSREYRVWDPEMDFFGNTMIQQLDIYFFMARVLQPMICMLSEGLFSCYDAFMDELSFHMMVHGRYDVGKTFAAIRTLIHFSTIPGTVSEFSQWTGKSDVTRKHCYDEIVAADECPEWLTDELAARQNQELVDKEKVKLVRGQVVQRTFTFIQMPDGSKVRWNEDVVTDHKKACVYVTNRPVKARQALSSRMFRITAKPSSVPVGEMDGDMAPVLKNDTRTWLHINQFLTTAGKKAAQVGYLLPEPEMTLFETVSNKVLDCLKTWGYVDADVGQRPLERMKPYLRQLVYKMAVRAAFDVPGMSPNYEKAFTPEMIREIQPFLYITISQIWWAWTACASDWIDEDMNLVLQAMYKVATGRDWKPKQSIYAFFEEDTKGRLPFRMRENKEHRVVQDANSGGGQSNPKDSHLIDLNYLYIPGTLDQAAGRISEQTNPHMTKDQVVEVLKTLADRRGTGCYEPQPHGTFAQWHKYHPAKKEDEDQHPKKRLGQPPAAYADGKEGDDLRPRDESHVPRFPEIHRRLPLVDLTESSSVKSGEPKIYFLPNAVSGFKHEVLMHALREATFCASTPPGKILLGITDRKDPSRVRVYTTEQRSIDEYVHRHDVEDGYNFDPEEDALSYTGTLEADLRPVSRQQGIAFNHRAAMHPEEAKRMTGQPWAPKPKGDKTYREQYADAAKLMSKTREIIPDLDAESARRQHMRCGRPLDEPVRTPAWIQLQIDLNCAPAIGLDYPHDNERIRERLEQAWNHTGSRNHNTKDKQEQFERESISSMLSRKQRQELAELYVQDRIEGDRKADEYIKKLHGEGESGRRRGREDVDEPLRSNRPRRQKKKKKKRVDRDDNE
jgi:hypothetical protein